MRLYSTIHIQVASLASLAQLLPPRSPTMSNPAPDSSLCRAAAPRLRPLQLLLAASVRFESAAAPWTDHVHPLHLLLPVCFHFQLLFPDCTGRPLQLLHAACSPLASASAAAPDRFRFGCCSPIQAIASASTAAPRIRLQPQLDSCS